MNSPGDVNQVSRPPHPILLIFAMAIAAALIVGAIGKATAARSGERGTPIAGAEQMRRQAQAVQALRSGQAADAYGRLVELADDGDGGAALLALAMVRHGPALYGSEWSITEGQLRRWSKSAFDDLQRQGAQIAAHDRGE
jgi:hypothetical protein